MKMMKWFVVVYVVGKDNVVSEFVVMDVVIDFMFVSVSEEELGKIVVENVLMFD